MHIQKSTTLLLYHHPLPLCRVSGTEAAVQHPPLERTHTPSWRIKARHEVPHISQGAEMHPLERTPVFFFRSFYTFWSTEARQNRPSCARRIPYKANEQVRTRLNAWDVAEVRREFRLASVGWSDRRNQTEARIDVQGPCSLAEWSEAAVSGGGNEELESGAGKSGVIRPCALLRARTWKRFNGGSATTHQWTSTGDVSIVRRRRTGQGGHEGKKRNTYQ